MRRFLLSTTFALLGGSVWAEDAALLLGNVEYRNFDRVPRAGGVFLARDGLEGLGFAVEASRNGGANQIAQNVAGFADRAQNADRLVVGLAGRFVTDGTRTWLLGSDAEDPTLFDLGADAVSVDAMLRVLAEKPGHAVLVLGTLPDEGQHISPYLRSGIGLLNAPNGVSIAMGTPGQVHGFLMRGLAQPEADLITAAQDYDVDLSGYVPAELIFMPAADEVDLSPGPVLIDPNTEAVAWQDAEALDDADSYRTYLGAYPRGQYADEAQSRLEAILSEPYRDQRLAEEALNLSRDARRQIQRHLTILDYNTRGIDGIFGSGTRRAMTNWQQENGYPQTSYLTTEQINRLDAQAARRSAQIEAEAEARRQELAQLDQAYWNETGGRGDAAGYRAYLERYPDGKYAAIAQAELDAIAQQALAQAESQERDAWELIAEADVISGYRQYLVDYPNGSFAEQANARITELTRPAEDTQAEAAAIAAENELNLNPITLRLIEGRLEDIGLEPGPVDGRLDEEARRAIRRYQQEHDLPMTGYLSEAVLVRLLADAVNQ